MGSHPLNLALRFLLELSALFTFGLWGWHIAPSEIRLLPAIGIPLAAAALWGTFAVPDDPSRSGKAPVAIPGAIRLLLEVIFFATAGWMIFDLNYSIVTIVFSALVIIHYALSYDRIAWLFKR